MAKYDPEIYERLMLQPLTPTLGKANGLQVQGALFAPALLPRQLPVFKYGPEDEIVLH